MPCEVSRQTITYYLVVLESTCPLFSRRGRLQPGPEAPSVRVLYPGRVDPRRECL